MWQFFEDSEPVAKKDYRCDAYLYWLSGTIDERDLGGDDLLIWQGAKSDGFMIKKGMKYTKRKGLFDGVWQTYKARTDLNDLCTRLDIFEE